jgi:hypothetical protein
MEQLLALGVEPGD